MTKLTASAVYHALSPRARLRTSPENVEDVLAAVGHVSNDQALLQQALEALESIDIGYRGRFGQPLEISLNETKCDAAVAALKERLK